MGIYIPDIYAEHSNGFHSTIEDVTTIKIKRLRTARLEAAGVNRNAVAKRLMDCYLKAGF